MFVGKTELFDFFFTIAPKRLDCFVLSFVVVVVVVSKRIKFDYRNITIIIIYPRTVSSWIESKTLLIPITNIYYVAIIIIIII